MEEDNKRGEKPLSTKVIDAMKAGAKVLADAGEITDLRVSCGATQMNLSVSLICLNGDCLYELPICSHKRMLFRCWLHHCSPITLVAVHFLKRTRLTLDVILRRPCCIKSLMPTMKSLWILSRG